MNLLRKYKLKNLGIPIDDESSKLIKIIEDNFLYTIEKNFNTWQNMVGYFKDGMCNLVYFPEGKILKIRDEFYYQDDYDIENEVVELITIHHNLDVYILHRLDDDIKKNMENNYRLFVNMENMQI